MRKKDPKEQSKKTFIINGRTYPCPFQLTMSIIESKWKLQIIWQLVDKGTMRYSELKKATVGGITHKMLIQTLRELADDGIVKRVMFAEVPPRVEYNLTKEGQRLTKVINAMSEFGHHYLKQDA